MTKNKRKKWMLLVIAIALLIVITEVMPKVISSIRPTITIEYGNLYIEDEVQCYALRDERVYFAGSDVETEFQIKEGKLIKVGSRILKYNPVESVNVESTEGEESPDSTFKQMGNRGVLVKDGYAKKKGVFTTYIDGHENYFKVSSFEKIKEDEAAKNSANLKDRRSSSYSKYEPMYKVVDQSKWYLMCWINSGDISKYSVGKRIDVNFDGTKVPFDIEKIQEEGDKWKILMSSNRYYKNFANFRTTKAKLVATDIDGILVPNESITTKNGEVGVYVVQKTGEYKFTKIKSYGSDGKYTVCAENIYYDAEGNLVETVKGFDEIQKKPNMRSEEEEGE